MTPEPRDVIAEWLDGLTDLPSWSDEWPDLILAALRAAGYETYRPEECMPFLSDGGSHRYLFEAGKYRAVPEEDDSLVPASDDTEGE